MKRKFAYLLVAALSVSMLAGCGSKSSSSKIELTKGSKVEVTMADVLENVAEAATGIEAVKIDVSGALDVEAESDDGETLTAEGDVSFKGNMVKDEPAFNFGGSASYELDIAGEKEKDDFTFAAYGETDGEEMNVYAQYNDSDWEVSTLEKSEFEESFEQIEEMLEEIQSGLADLSEDDLKDIEKFVKLEDNTQKVSGTECYVLTMAIDADIFEEMLQYSEDYIDTDLVDEAETYLDVLKELDVFEVTTSLYFDKDTYLPAKVSLNVNVDGDVEGVSVKVNKCNLEISLQVNGDVEVEEVPDKVRENAVEIDDDYDYDFDFDFDDDDDDDEEETITSKKDKDKEDADYTTETTALPKSIKIEGTEISMPGKYAAVEKLGLVINEEYSDVEIPSESQGSLILEDKDDTLKYVIILMYNPGKNTADYKDCEVVGITIDDSFEWELDNGIKIGDDLEAVKKKYEGVKPSYEYESSLSLRYSYEDEKGNEITYSFDTETNALYEVEISWYEY